MPLEMLSLLLRADATTVETISMGLPVAQRAALAAFCYNRRHLRSLAFRLALHCDDRSLVRAAGTVGIVLYEQSRDPAVQEDEQPRHKPKGISLARMA
ncbi:hypothetical protein ASG54_05895 [Aureimonas sp. Leaf460]|nr:hypothetical protein ASG62_00365 [Aureimonas sp. Leaf427]KQT80980.1 hypothetical protein ASG54_05895 [Aureimonas sp. Leaf460]